VAPAIADGVNAELVRSSVSASNPGSSGAQLSSEHADSVSRLRKLTIISWSPRPTESVSVSWYAAAASITASSEPLSDTLL